MFFTIILDDSFYSCCGYSEFSCLALVLVAVSFIVDVLPQGTPGLLCSGCADRCIVAGIFLGGSFGLMIQRMTPALTLSVSSVLLPAGAPSWCTRHWSAELIT